MPRLNHAGGASAKTIYRASTCISKYEALESSGDVPMQATKVMLRRLSVLLGMGEEVAIPAEEHRGGSAQSL